MRVVIYGRDPEETGKVREGLAAVLRARQEWPAFQEFTGAREPFLHYVRNNPYLVMFVIQRGPEAAETVRLAKEANPAARLVWLCDHDYALYAFGLHLTYFGLLPACRENLEQAMDACQASRVPSGQLPPQGEKLLILICNIHCTALLSFVWRGQESLRKKQETFYDSLFRCAACYGRLLFNSDHTLFIINYPPTIPICC